MRVLLGLPIQRVTGIHNRDRFSFSILLPATLATSDYHPFGRLTYIITATVQGIAHTSSFSSIFKAVTTPSTLDPDIPYVGDFERVIGRSDKLAAESRSRSASTSGRARSESRDSVPAMRNFPLGGDDGTCAITIGGNSPPMGGLYTTRRHSSSILSSASSMSIPTLSLSPEEEDRGRPSFSPISSANGGHGKADKADWMKGDLCASRELLVHAVDPLTGGEIPLDVRKEGFVEGLGSWRFSANAEAVS